MEKVRKKRNAVKVIKITALLLTATVVLLGFFIHGNHTGLSFYGLKAYKVASGSMEPRYKVGSIVVADSGGFNKVSVGDVIAFRAKALGGNIAFHRVTRITEEGFFVKGDSNRYEDAAAVTADDYVGRVIISVNFFTYVAAAIQTFWGAVLLLLFSILMLYIICGAYFMLRQRNKEKQDI